MHSTADGAFASRRFFPASALLSSHGHTLTTTAEGDRHWEVMGHRAWFVCGPYAHVKDGVYRVKAWANVAEADKQSYMDVFDTTVDNRVYSYTYFHDDPELYVRVYNSSHLEFRFRTHGEHLKIYGVELEAVLLDDQNASSDQLRALLEQIIKAKGASAAVHRVIDRLGDLAGAAEAEQRRAVYVAGSVAGMPIERFECDVLEQLRRLHSTSAVGRERPLPPLSGGQAAVVIERRPLRMIDVGRGYPDIAADLRALGYEPDFIDATRFHREYDEPARAWHDRRLEPDRPKQFPIRQPLFERYVDIDRSHQTALARGKGYPAHCPISGRLLRSKHGFLIVHQHKPFIFYRFSGDEVFYICTGMNSDVPLFMYLPKSELIILIGDPVYHGYPFDEIVRVLNINLVNFGSNCEAYLLGETKPAAVIGNDNYGHYFWLDMSGLQFAIENSLNDFICALIKTPSQFAVAEEIFPELARLPVDCCDDQVTAFQRCVERRYVPIRFTDVAITSAFVERLHATARVHAPQALPPIDAPRPLLWLNLRAHNKIWTNQAEGYAAILNALYEDYGQASALLDGVSDCDVLATRIRDLTRPEVVLYNGLAFSLYEKINWGRAVDGYICVIGTGLIIVHSLAGARGVAHGNREHMTQLAFWETIQPGSGSPLAPEMNQIIDAPGDDLQRDYEVDWRVLLELIRSHLSTTFNSATSERAAAAQST